METLTSDHLAKTSGDKFKQRMLRFDARDTLPITLRHRRIYILPTARGMAFLGVVMVMILASMNYGLNLGYALSFMMIGLFASCLLSTFMNLNQLRIISATATDAFDGQAVNFVVTLSSESNRAKHSINVAANGSDDRIDLKSSANSVANLTIKDQPRGQISLGRITLSSDFPLGLWRGWGYVHAPVSAYVYPKPETDAPAIACSSNQQGSSAQTAAGEREFSQLKPYQDTDSPASVAWKQVARGGNWYSKEFEPEYKNQHSDIRWVDTPANAGIEVRLSRMCAWVVRAEKSGTPFSFEMPGLARPAQTGPDHLQDCLRKLATFSTGKNQ